jgi:AICAR transformylase/IMP cyclohydrolase PurH
LEEAIESAKRLAVFAWAHETQYDEAVRDFALKVLRLPTSFKRFETKGTGKKEAFSMQFLEQYNEAKYQQLTLRAATNNNSHGSSQGGHVNHLNQQHRRGRGFYRREKKLLWRKRT